MESKSKARMNLVAIKKVDPYARDIVTSSSHVAFYTFNSEKNEWEKTDVEGAFFIYSRNAQPYHSIFINNRLNTNSFVEPITTQLELQSQPPFLLYRNERSRIRGFWFYNSDECDRVSNLVTSLVQVSNGPVLNTPTSQTKQENVNLFKMLSDAQKEYNMQTRNKTRLSDAPSNNVLEFFAAAKPATVDKTFHPHLLPNTLSVEQIEKQQRSKTNDKVQNLSQQLFPSKVTPPPLGGDGKPLEPTEIENGLSSLLDSINLSSKREINVLEQKPVTNYQSQDAVQKFLWIKPNNVALDNDCVTHEVQKPALMPPTMFEKLSRGVPNAGIISFRQEPLTSSQLVQTFNYLMQNDEEFVHKLHEAYLQVYAKTVVDTYQ